MTAVETQDSAVRLERQLAELARFSLPGHGVSRPALTQPYFEALGYLERLAAEVGMQVRYDPVGNFIASRVPPGVASFALGSHIDSVIEGGAYDGIAGVVCGFEVARLLPQAPLTVIAFIGEEASRFPTGLLGSRCVLGKMTVQELKRCCDAEGVSFFEAATQAGYHPERVAESADLLDQLLGYLEIHIEQGRVLEEEGLQLGLVTDVVGLVHAYLEISGRADHAGGTPMNLRSDAGLTAAEVVTELERYVRSLDTTPVGTVGEISLEPGARNIIPGLARVGLDVRDRDLAVIDQILEHIRTFAQQRAATRGQQVTYREDLRNGPVAMNPEVIGGLEEALHQLGLPYRRMVSGGGHDAMIVAPQLPTGMLFVPCREGISHSPHEYAEPRHLAQAVQVAVRYIEQQLQH